MTTPREDALPTPDAGATAVADRPAPVVDEQPDPPITFLFRRLYALFYNKVFGIAIILAMAVATLLGTVIAQAPTYVLEEPELYNQWLARARMAFGGWTPVLSALGLFQVFSSWWFRVITVLLALSIVACTTHRMPQLWARATRPHVHASDALFEQARYRSRLELAETPDAALDRVKSLLAARHYRVLTDAQDSGSLYADRHRWMPFGTAIAHTGFVVICLGVLVTSLLGFSDDLKVTVGQRVDVGRQSGLTIEAKAFADTYYTDGRPKDYTSDLVLYRGDQQVAEQTVRVNQPLRYERLSFHQASFGIAGVVDLKDASGATLFAGGIPLNSTNEDGSVVSGQVSTGRGEQVVYAATAASGNQASVYAPGQLLVALYDSPDATQPTFSKVLEQGKPVTMGGVTGTFVREAPFTDLMVNHDPGAPWVWLGSALTLVGIFCTMLFKHRRVWVRVQPGPRGATVALASPERHDSVFERWMTALVTDLDAGATAPRKEA